MKSDCFRFGPFTLDQANRRLFRDGERLKIGARYFDALSLLVRHPGELMTKDQLMDQVWHGVPVTDEALTQCIRNLRQLFSDEPGSPRFIETVPKHGYRFIAPVSKAIGHSVREADHQRWPVLGLFAAAGTIGGGMAGLVGGLIYGLAGVSRTPNDGGQISILLVIICLCILTGLLGGAGISIGIAFASRKPNLPGYAAVVGGALGGLAIGASGRLLGIDAFTLLFGHPPAQMTGAVEGSVLGIATGSGVWLARRYQWSVSRASILSAGIGASAGLLIALAGGTLMAGSLNSLARSFNGSNLTMDHFAAVFGEGAFGPVTHAVATVVEGMLFAGSTVAALLLADRAPSERRIESSRPSR